LSGGRLYADIWDNKPPFLYVLYALFHSDLFSVRVFSFVVGLFAVLGFYFLAKALFQKPQVSRNTTLLFAFLFGLPLLEGNIANAENFMLLPILLCAFFLFRFLSQKEQNTKKLILPGVLLSIAFLFKIVAIFDFAAFFLFLVFVTMRDLSDIRRVIKIVIPFVGGFFAPIGLVFLYFLVNGTLSMFIDAAFRQNVGYVGYGNQLFIPQGLLIAKVVLLGFVVLLLFIKRRTLSPSYLFLTLWFFFSLFNAFFPQRPYTHYLLVLLPSLCLIVGLFSKETVQSFVQHSQSRFSLLFRIHVAVFFFLLLLILSSFHLYGKTILYYPNFVLYFLGGKSTSAYQAFFDSQTPKDYNIVSFLSLHQKKGEGLFVWGNDGQLYALTHTLPPGRYIVAYHMTATKKTLAETEAAFQRSLPRYVILSTNSLFPFSLARYRQRIIIDGIPIYERAY